jgi:hypothetical protein
MESLWPWLVVAGAGALHGLNPATGWLLAAGWGWRSRDRRQAIRALVPIAVGHLASIALVVAAVAWGLSLDRGLLQAGALVLLGGAAGLHLFGCMPLRIRAPAGHLGLALWSFTMATSHGAGLALIPALLPLCVGLGPDHVGASGLLLPAVAAVGLHAAAMLVTTGLLATLLGPTRPARSINGFLRTQQGPTG